MDSTRGIAVGYGGAILRTTNGGKNWNRLLGIPSYYNLVDVSFANANIGVAVGFDQSSPGAAGLVLRTTNGGKNWGRLTISDSLTFVSSVSFANADVGVAAGNGPILWTTDGGRTWTKHQIVGLSFFTKSFCVDSQTAFVVSGINSILRTTDGGSTWNQFVLGGGTYITGIWFTDANHGFLVDPDSEKVYRTTNGGSSWTQQYITGSPWGVAFVDSTTGIIMGNSIYHTTNAGLTWQEVGTLDMPAEGFNSDIALPRKDINHPVVEVSVWNWDFSQYNSFILQPSDNCTPYPVVTPVSPPDGAQHQVFDAVSSSSLTLVWDCLPSLNVLSSTVQLALDSVFSDPPIADTSVLLNGSLVNTSLTIDLIPGKSYYWRVQIMFTDSTVTNWSDTWRFNTAKAVIAGSMFEDLNRDGIQNNGEQNLQGGAVDLTGGHISTRYTDTNGTFSFGGLDSGLYTVTGHFPASWIVSTPPSGSYNINLGANDTVPGRIFGGYFPWNSAGGTVFDDRNDNGIKESWEAGLPNWKIIRGGISTDSVLTDSTGEYNFYPLVLGTYSLTATMQPAWEQVNPRFQSPNSVTFNGYDQHPTNLNFAVHRVPERIKLPLTIKDDITTNKRDIWFGQRPGATFGISGVDPAATNYDYSEGESELPPAFSGQFDGRFVTPRSANQQFGYGSWTDMRAFSSSTQIDTFKVSFRPGNSSSEEYSFTLSWSKASVAASYSGAVILVDIYNNATDMKATDSVQISDPAITFVRIITHAPIMSVQNLTAWNMVSLPYDVTNKQVTALFPSSISPAFSYSSLAGYQANGDMTLGTGYWLKYSLGLDPVPTNGTPLLADTIDVAEGWNIIGSVASAVDVLQITSLPAGIVTSQFFGYNAGYNSTPTIEPGKAYWIKVSQAGQLILSSPQVTSASNRIRIVPTSELPPSPPAGDDGSRLSSQIPSQFSLEQNFPNPFNPVTQIRYAIRDAGYVTLKIYNVLGQEVVTLVDEVQEAGDKSIDWDASDRPSGVYFCRLDAGGLTDVKKLVLLR